MRRLREIQDDIAAASATLATLENERARVRAARRDGIVADFDAGLSRAAIAAKWEVDYGHVAGVLHKARRTEKTRRARDLTPAQRQHYAIALRGGASSALARRIAEAVA
ncbi:MAG: hypothetical protein KIS73_19925 [Enhydrobacter sp.]|nr:hypothetical protein [Enhydrobacter sp.]